MVWITTDDGDAFFTRQSGNSGSSSLIPVDLSQYRDLSPYWRSRLEQSDSAA
jgi:hypothetical protein